MQIFLDTADIALLKAGVASGLVDGVTTNPSLIAKSGRDFKEVIAEICGFFDGSVSAEVAAIDAPTMIAEGRELAKIAPNVTIKIPLTRDGLIATKTLADEGREVNVTLCFSPVQALLAAKAGAAYISPFIGRLDDMQVDGMKLIEEIRAIYDNYAFDTKILAASIRSVTHVRDCALAGADCATIPVNVFDALFKHPLTDKGLEQFLADWKGTGQSIL
jgi:transaldolase